METYLGEKTSFWSELKRKAELLDVTDLIRENGDLRAKLSFLESRIKQINDFLNTYQPNAELSKLDIK